MLALRPFITFIYESYDFSFPSIVNHFITRSRYVTTSILYSVSVYLKFDQRPDISLVCNCDIVGYAKQDDSPKDENAVVHGLRSSRSYWWPKTEKDDNDHENTGHEIYGDAQ